MLSKHVGEHQLHALEMEELGLAIFDMTREPDTKLKG
jgi:hypothetical protein